MSVPSSRQNLVSLVWVELCVKPDALACGVIISIDFARHSALPPKWVL